MGCRIHVPVWHEATREWVKQGRLALLGVTQEQHPDRCQLFAQWKQFHWPILHDPINVLEAPAVPIVVAIDEYGIVRAIKPRPETFAAEFLDKTFTDDASPGAPRSSGSPDVDALVHEAEASPSAANWRLAGDALTIWGGNSRVDASINAYGRAIQLDPQDKNAQFRLGVAYRMRHESAVRQSGDFQKAVDAWGRALELDPNQYIWRRRIEQYGPRLAKPYAFYDWVAQAKTEIARRGEVPVPLVVEPYGSELAGPSRTMVAEKGSTDPDPEGRILRDNDRLIEAEVVLVPARIRPGQAARVHVTFRPSTIREAHWNNESSPLRIWIGAPEGWTTSARLLEAPLGNAPESDEIRRLEFEIKAPSTTGSGKTRIPAYALYNTCEQKGGRCLFLRQDLTIELDIVK